MVKKSPKITGERLVKIRRERGWSQERLAEQLGLSRRAIIEWEKNDAVPRWFEVWLIGEDALHTKGKAA